MRSPSKREPIVVERILSAPPEEVFAAWGDAESLGAWMCPDPVGSSHVELDFRVGGRFTLLMRGDDRDYAHHGEYLEIDPPKRLVMTWVSEWVPEDEQLTRVSVTFEPSGDGGTRLRLVHDELPETDTYDGHVRGWASILEKLETRTRRAT